jgi:hypothetical protein
MHHPTNLISSLRVVKTIESLARDVTKTTGEKGDREAVDTLVGSAKGMKSRPGEVHRKLWRTAEIQVVVTTGELAMIVMEGTVDVIDGLEEKTNTRDVH